MAFVFQRRLAIRLWAVAFFTVALISPPTATAFTMPLTTVFAITAVGIAAILFLMPRPIPCLRTSQALVRFLPSGTPRSSMSRAVTHPLAPGRRCVLALTTTDLPPRI